MKAWSVSVASKCLRSPQCPFSDCQCWASTWLYTLQTNLSWSIPEPIAKRTGERWQAWIGDDWRNNRAKLQAYQISKDKGEDVALWLSSNVNAALKGILDLQTLYEWGNVQIDFFAGGVTWSPQREGKCNSRFMSFLIFFLPRSMKAIASTCSSR